MTDQSETVSWDNETQEITVRVPCQLAERVERYANENGNTISGVVIEALDTFLRGRKLDLSGW